MRLWPRKQVYVDDLPRTHDLRFAAVFILLFAAVLGLVYTVGFFVAGDRLPHGTTVAGVDVGGMRWAEARTELQEQLVPRLETPLTVTALDQTFTVDPQRAGMTFDLDATLRAGLGGERWDPRHMLKVLLGGSELPIVVDVDNGELDATLERIAAKVERAPSDAGVDFALRGPQVSEGVDGVALDYNAAADALQSALVDGDSEVDLPVEAVEPAITTTEATVFSNRTAARAVSGPVRLRIADTVRMMPAARFVGALAADRSSGRLELAVRPKALLNRNRDLLASLPHHPVNARFRFDGGHPVVVPSRSGVSVSADALAAAVLKAALRKGDERVATAKVTPDLPAFTTADARRLHIDRVVTTARLTVAPSYADRVRAVANRLDGTIVRPRDSLSILGRVGAADPQASSLLASAVYDAAFRAGLGGLDRSGPRTFTPGAEPGLDAVVAPGVDLGFTNDTPWGVYVRAVLDDSGQGRPTLVVQLWGKPYWNVSVTSSGRYNVVQPQVRRVSVPGCRPSPGRPGFEVDVNRTLSHASEGRSTESTHSVYQVSERVVCTRR